VISQSPFQQVSSMNETLEWTDLLFAAMATAVHAAHAEPKR
jgi:hypothetical protein